MGSAASLFPEFFSFKSASKRARSASSLRICLSTCLNRKLISFKTKVKCLGFAQNLSHKIARLYPDGKKYNARHLLLILTTLHFKRMAGHQRPWPPVYKDGHYSPNTLIFCEMLSHPKHDFKHSYSFTASRRTPHVYQSITHTSVENLTTSDFLPEFKQGARCMIIPHRPERQIMGTDQLGVWFRHRPNEDWFWTLIS